MTCAIPFQRRVRLRGIGAVAALCAAGVHAATASAPADQCIVGDHAIGCISERSIVELTTRPKDASTLQQLVQDKLASGQCRLFDYGERVQVTSSRGSERTLIHRPGDKTSYWIPASWSRPIAECQGTPSATALHQKLGIPDAPKQATDAEDHTPSLADEDTDNSPRWRDDDDAGFQYDRDRRPPPWPSRPLPSSRYAHACAFKPVMTDADLAACRNLRR